MAITKTIQGLLKTIDDSVSEFVEGLSPIQQQNYRRILQLVKQLDLQGQNIKVNVNNMKLLSKINAELESVVVSDPYVKQVAQFAETFTAVQTLQNDYFASLNVGFTPKKVFEELKKINVDTTIELLTESGIGAEYTSTIKEILTTNITSGGSYADMTETLRDAIIGKEGEEGTLVKYARQISDTAINQFNANYNVTVANDLGLDWFQYTGSLITTSREWCEKMVEKRYFHISEIPTLLKGLVDGHQCAINPKTGLPNGMIPGTNAKTIFTLRGGYGPCRHQIFATITEDVPKEVRNRIEEQAVKDFTKE